MLDWGASDFGTDLGRCHFIGAVQNEEQSIKVHGDDLMRTVIIIYEDGGSFDMMCSSFDENYFIISLYLIFPVKVKIIENG